VECGDRLLVLRRDLYNWRLCPPNSYPWHQTRPESLFSGQSNERLTDQGQQPQITQDLSKQLRREEKAAAVISDTLGSGGGGSGFGSEEAARPPRRGRRRYESHPQRGIISSQNPRRFGDGGGRRGSGYCAVLAVEKDKAGEQRKEREKGGYLT
jgi:hypothetical protein